MMIERFGLWSFPSLKAPERSGKTQSANLLGTPDSQGSENNILGMGLQHKDARHHRRTQRFSNLVPY